jgi:hypothetical protein
VGAHTLSAAALLLAESTELRSDVRQFWWHKGEADKPARLIVMNVHDTPPEAEATELTGSCPPGRVPSVLAVIDLKDGLDLDIVSPVLDLAGGSAK